MCCTNQCKLIHVIVSISVDLLFCARTRISWRASDAHGSASPGIYELMHSDIGRIKKRAQQNIANVCDALFAEYDATELNGNLAAEKFLLVRNCEDLLFYSKEENEAPFWEVKGVDVISGHDQAVLTRLEGELKNPTIVLSCEFVQRLSEDRNQHLMEKLSNEKVPVLIFDRLIWWKPGHLFTFEPPFGAKKFPEDPNKLEDTVKTTESMPNGVEGLKKMVTNMKEKAGAKEGKDFTIQRDEDGKMSSVTLFRRPNPGTWNRRCRAFYDNEKVASYTHNPFQCQALQTKSYFLASLAEGLFSKFVDQSVISGLWVVKENFDFFSLHPIAVTGKEDALPVDMDVSEA